MRDQYANILCHHHEVPFSRGYDTYEWRGPRNLPVIVSGNFVDNVSVLPWPMILIEKDLAWDRYTYIRTDNATWVITWSRHKAGDLLRSINTRLMATCAVWGLLDYSPWIAPSWGDLKAVKAIGRVFHA